MRVGIENASFKLDDDTFQLESNDGQHHLHGSWIK